MVYWLNEHVHPKKCREGIVLIPSWEKLEWCSAAKKRWWYNEYLKNGLVLSEAKFFNFISSLGRQATLKTFVLPDHPTCSEYYLCQSLKFSLYQFFFCRTCTAIYKAKKITLGKGEGSRRTSSHLMEKSNLGYQKPFGHPNTTGLQQEKGGSAHFFPGMEWNASN